MSFLYGVELGTGILTRMNTGMLYVILIWVTTRGDLVLGALIVALFSVGRSLPIFVTSRGSPSVELAVAIASRLDACAPLARLISGLLLALTAGAAATRWMYSIYNWYAA